MSTGEGNGTMNNFNLIMENWRGFLQEEKIEELGFGSKAKMNKATGGLPGEEPTHGMQTVGDLRKFVKLMRMKTAGGEIGKRAVAALADILPGGGTILGALGDIKDGAGLLRKLYSMDDKYQSNTKMDALNIDDNVSKIVDDPIETNFVNYMIKDKFANASDDESLDNYNMTKLLQDYIAKEFDKITVKK